MLAENANPFLQSRDAALVRGAICMDTGERLLSPNHDCINELGEQPLPKGDRSFDRKGATDSWVGNCRPWTSAIRTLNSGVSFPAVRSLTLLSLADPQWRGQRCDANAGSAA